MTLAGLARCLIFASGLMGAAGVALAAAGAHLPDAGRLSSAAPILLFHAAALLGATALAERGIVHPTLGLCAAFGFVIGACLFSGDLSLRHFTGGGLFPRAAPIGGSLLMLSWLLLAIAAIWPRKG